MITRCGVVQPQESQDGVIWHRHNANGKPKLKARMESSGKMKSRPSRNLPTLLATAVNSYIITKKVDVE